MLPRLAQAKSRLRGLTLALDCQSCDLRATPEFDERLASREQCSDARPRVEDKDTQLRIPNIPTRDPHNLRRRAVTLDELHKIVILRDHDGRAAGPRRPKDRRIVGVQLLDLVDVESLNPVGLPEPARERRR